MIILNAKTKNTIIPITWPQSGRPGWQGGTSVFDIFAPISCALSFNCIRYIKLKVLFPIEDTVRYYALYRDKANAAEAAVNAKKLGPLTLLPK